MRSRLPKLQNNNEEVKAPKSNAAGLLKGQKDIEGVLQYQGLLCVLELIYSKVISCHHNDLLVEHFDIDKIKELVNWKYC